MHSPKLQILFVAVCLLLVFTFAFADGAKPAKGYTDGYNEMTVAQLEAQMAAGTLTSEKLTNAYIARIVALDQSGPGVNAVIELNPDALNMARYADKLRRNGIILGPMHGIPVLLKGNVDTGDLMQTTAGSFALVGSPAHAGFHRCRKLRAGGAVILGKTNLSEWANFRSFESISGWSGWGGQTNNPYGIARNPCGSSAGSAASASANFTTVSFGTETDGSIVCPANANGVVGIKPTVDSPAAPASCRFRIRRTRSDLTGAMWPTPRSRWAWCRASRAIPAIRLPAACLLAGRVAIRVRPTSHPTTHNF